MAAYPVSRYPLSHELLSHLFFADDIVLFCGADNCRNFSEEFWVKLSTQLRAKSCKKAPSAQLHLIKDVFDFQIVKEWGLYLGVPLVDGNLKPR